MFGHLWHLDAGMGAQLGIPGDSTPAAEFAHHNHRGNKGVPACPGEPGTALGSAFGVQAGGCSRQLGSGALGSHPTSVSSLLGNFG